MPDRDVSLHLRGLFVAVCFVSIFHVPAFAQTTNVVDPAPSSPHWPHINVLDFGRGLKYISDATQRATAYRWFSTHVDIAEGVASDLRANNVTMKVFTYALDATLLMSMSDAGLTEEEFLHASENTTLEFHDLANNPIRTVNIPGCPDPQALSKTCRFQAFIWTDSRWIFNPKSTAYRSDKANQLLALTQSAQTDGIFLDEHSPGLQNTMSLNSQTYIRAGGGIREYGGVQPASADTSYNTDVVGWLGSLRNVFKNAGKFVLVNLADYSLDPRGIDQIMAAGGVTTEYLHRPDRLDRNQYQQLISLATNLVASGGMLDLYGTIGYLGPSGYTAGNYGTSAARYRMWRVASYYILKEPVGSSGKVYFDPNFNIDYGSATPTSFINEWLPAYQVNVGQPTGAAVVFQQGQTPAACGKPYIIFGRQYTNALVLVRPNDNWDCTDYGDNSAVVVSFTQPMSMLKSDGSLAASSTTIKIRNAEAVILFPSTSTGSSSTTTGSSTTSTGSTDTSTGSTTISTGSTTTSTGTTTTSTGSTSTSTGSTSTTTTSTSTSTGSSSSPTKNVPPGQLKKQDSLYDQILGWMKFW